jgi:hypothetical protein
VDSLEARLFTGGFCDDPSARVSVGGKLISRFRPIDDALAQAGFYLEFLTPLEGDGLDRRTGEPQVCVDLQPPVTAVPLRYLELLLFEPLELVVVRRSRPTARIPHPALYAMQKLLINKERRKQGGGKMAKDCDYVFDIARLFGRDSGAALGAALKRALQVGGYPRSWFTSAARTAFSLFGKANGAGIQSVIERRSDLHQVEVVILMAPLLAAFDSALRE